MNFFQRSRKPKSTQSDPVEISSSSAQWSEHQSHDPQSHEHQSYAPQNYAPHRDDAERDDVGSHYEPLKDVFVYDDDEPAIASVEPSHANSATATVTAPYIAATSNLPANPTALEPVGGYVDQLRVHGGASEHPQVKLARRIQAHAGSGAGSGYADLLGTATVPRSKALIPVLAAAHPTALPLDSVDSSMPGLESSSGAGSGSYVAYASETDLTPVVASPFSPSSSYGSVMDSTATQIPGYSNGNGSGNGNGNGSYAGAPSSLDSVALSSVVLATQREIQKERELLHSAIQQIRGAEDQGTVFSVAASKIRELLRGDRAVVYRFTTPDQGLVVAEAVNPGWTPCQGEYLPALFFGGGNQSKSYEERGFYLFGRNEQTGFSPYHLQLLERFQVKASLAIPLWMNERIWGLIALHHCSQSRHWEEADIEGLNRLAIEVRLKLQSLEFADEFSKQVEQEAVLVKVIQKIQEATDVESIFRSATAELRKALKCDRTAIYRFNEDWTGEVMAESVGAGWVSILQEQARDPNLYSDLMPEDCTFVNLYPGDRQVISFEQEDSLLKRSNGGQFNQGVPFRKVDDVYAMGFADCYIQMCLEKFQCRAYIHAPIFQDGKLWGILCAYQNDGPRQWSMADVNLLVNLTTPLNTALQQARTIQQIQQQTQQMHEAAQREQVVGTIVSRIRETLDVAKVFKATTQELRRFMHCDRAVIYRFNPDWSGEFIAESVGPRLNSILGQGFSAEMGNCQSLTSLRPDGIPLDSRDPRIAEQSRRQGRDYNRSGFFLDDVQNYDLPGDFLDAMEQIGTRAYLMSGIFVGGKIWGMVALYHGSPMNWKEDDRQLVAQVAAQCGLALQQVQYVEQLQAQSEKLQAAAERERTVASLINRIRESQKSDVVFRIVTQEVRRLLSCDRTVIYRFNADWSGEVVAESVGNGWLPLLQLQAQDQSLRNDLMASDTCVVKYYGTAANEGEVFKQDTYLRDTKGGQYSKGARFRQVNDVVAMNFAPCYQQTLEKFQCKAYINVPIFQGAKLWGLMAAYQNDGPRDWSDVDVNLLLQISPQLGITLQQAEYLEQLEAQSQQLQAVVDREIAAKDQLQEQVVQLLRAVRPALSGDLTVRAPLTEDAVGTVADAYNNTIQSLRQIVIKVKDTATTVSDTSRSSTEAIAQLSLQAQREVAAIQQALQDLDSMSGATQAVVANAKQVEVAVQQANQVVQRGDLAMNRTVEGIQAIRSTVSETGKKIKRLSESSQKISRVVSLIGDFTTQTQLLALNAAIEATRAGEYGRGFAVVADEVRSLARQSAEATSEIEKLVQEIQAETSAVTEAMDVGIDQVVNGTALVTETRQSLNDIVLATAQISELVDSITSAAQSQSQQFGSVNATMNQVTAIAHQTSTDSLNISEAFQTLLSNAETLQATVGKFKV